MAKIDKIVELINRYNKEIKEHYKISEKLEVERNSFNKKFSYNEGNNDAYINAKEQFVEELEELKEYYSYE
jgi:hypothetical protein